MGGDALIGRFRRRWPNKKGGAGQLMALAQTDPLELRTLIRAVGGDGGFNVDQCGIGHGLSDGGFEFVDGG